jgi:drug/metabolite transporter (DMT)-like permease
MTSRHTPILLTLAAALLWGSSFTVVKVGLRYLDPYSFVLLRFLAATGLLVVLVLARGQWHLFTKYLGDRYTVFLGLTIAASYGFQFVGQVRTTASNAVIIVNSSAVLVAPLSYLLLKEAIGPRQLVSLAMGVVGVYLIARGRGGASAAAGQLAGDLLVAGSALAYGFYVVLTRMAVTRRTFSEIPLMAAVFAWSVPVFLVMSVPTLARGVTVTKEAWAAIGYLAVFCSILPFTIWTAAMKRIGAVTSAIVLLAELIFGVVIARIVLSETPSPATLAGCCVIAAAILVVGLKAETGPAGAN